MALTVAELAFVFGADTRAVDQGYDKVKAGARSTAKAMDSSMTGFWREEKTRATRAANDYGAAGKKAGAQFKQKFSSETKNLLTGAGIGLGAYEIVKFFGSAITTASDLGETMSKVGVIFGDSQTQIAQWAEDTDRNILLTKQQALDAASTFGIFGKAAGKTGEDLADFSLDLTSLAQDFSSFFNARPEDAILAIGAALRGENEPIRQFGVLLDDATLRARALKMGLISTTKDALTPQQKALAAYQEILAQTSDAQGDAKRTQDGFANSSRQMQQEVAKLKEEIGTRLLPAATGFVHFMRDTGVPVLTTGVGVIGDLASEFSSLPGPVKAAAGAFALLKIAAALGWTDAASRGVDQLKTAVGSAQQRAEWFRLAYANARNTVMQFGTAAGAAAGPTSRLTAAMTGARAASMGLGTAAKGVVGFFGGPWGIALTAATAGLTYFWQENQKAKAFVDELTASLDKQSGKLTDQSTDIIASKLKDSGAVEAAKELGVNLTILQAAAEGNTGALASLRRELGEFADVSHAWSTMGGRNIPDPFHFKDIFGDDKVNAANTIRDALGEVGIALDTSAEDAHDLAVMTGEVAEEQSNGAAQMKKYGQRTAEAADAVRRLWEAENKRRLAAVQAKRDELALIETTKAAMQEAREGKKTLDEQTQAGRDNWAALLDLADQWNNSKNSVRNARGAYAEMRDTFIEVAMKMGASEDKAERLAKRLLTLPRKVPIRFQTEGMKEAIREAERLRALLAMGPVRIGGGSMVGTNQHAAEAYADGGEVRGLGGPRSDRIWARVSPGEWVTPNGPSQKYRRQLEAIRADDALGLKASMGGGGVNTQELAAAFAQMVGGRLAPAMHVDTLKVETLADTQRYQAQQQHAASVGGERWE